MNTIAVSDLRTNLPTIIDQIAQGLDRLIITVSGKPKAVVMSVEDLESIEETNEVMAIPGILKSIKKSQEQIKNGQYTTLEKYLTKNDSLKRSRKRSR